MKHIKVSEDILKTRYIKEIDDQDIVNIQMMFEYFY